jgi:hypothetical protein
MNKLFTNIAISYLSYLPTSKSRLTKPCLFGCANTNNYDSIFNFPKLCSSPGTSRVISLRQPYFDAQVIDRIIPNLDFLGSTEDAISSSPSLWGLRKGFRNPSEPPGCDGSGVLRGCWKSSMSCTARLWLSQMTIKAHSFELNQYKLIQIFFDQKRNLITWKFEM